MTISAQNIRLPHLGADLRPAQPEPYNGPVATALDAVTLLDVMKPVCGPDDFSDAGPWGHRIAFLVDGDDKRVLRAGGL